MFNLYDGRIVGGTSQNIGYVSINIHGGATIRADGIFNMYGGMIEGGNCYTDGGIIYVSGTANLYGGTITGGKSDTHGSGMFAASGSTVTISGDIQITGNEGDNLCLDRFANLIIDEGNLNGAMVGITALNPGELSACTDPTVLQCLVSDDPTLKLSLKNGMLYLG